MPPEEEAKAVFRRLGYTVSGDGSELRAERKWRTVHVTALDADTASTSTQLLPDGGSPECQLRCFVTWMDYTGALRDRLERLDPPYEWAVVGVDDDEGHEVVDRGGAVA
ncbi:MAG: hypothetical protein ABEJ82_02775 [Haloplanus sp.]